MELSGAAIVAIIGAIIILAHFFRWVFSFTAIPNGLLLMIVGLIAAASGFASPETFGTTGMVLLTITLVLMLFESGTRLSIKSIRVELPRALILTGAFYLLTMAVVSLILVSFTSFSLLLSLLIGSIVGGTSSTVVIPYLNSLNVAVGSKTLLTLESALSDVLVIVITIALLQAAAGSQASLLWVGFMIIASFLSASLVGLAAGFVWSLLLDRIRHLKNSIFITFAFLFLLYGLVEELGFSGPITALSFGITLGNVGSVNEYLAGKHRWLAWLIRPIQLSRRERAFFAEIVFLLETFFFIFVGLSIPLTNLTVLGLGLAICLILLLVRLLAVRLVSSHIPVDDAGFMAVLIPKGMASAVLAGLIVQSSLLGGIAAQELIYGIILWSIVITSILIFLLSKTRFRAVYGSLSGSQVAEPLSLGDARITGGGNNSTGLAGSAAGTDGENGNYPAAGSSAGLG